jgi:hypothetical protein
VSNFMEVDWPVSNVLFNRVWAHIATLQFYLMDQPKVVAQCHPPPRRHSSLLQAASLTSSTAAVSTSHGETPPTRAPAGGEPPLPRLS